MKDIKDYVFFTIFKDDDRTKDEGSSYGVKRGSCTNHELYFREFLGIDSLAFEEDLTVFRAIEREDVTVKDEKAFVNGYISTTPALATAKAKSK